jgi:hypothetical protein
VLVVYEPIGHGEHEGAVNDASDLYVFNGHSSQIVFVVILQIEDANRPAGHDEHDVQVLAPSLDEYVVPAKQL